MQKFTVCIKDNQEAHGTTHVQAYRARSMEGAIRQAKRQVRADWGWDRNTPSSELHVLAVMEGDVKILLWED